MYKKITKERADEITAAWDAATDVQRLGMQRIQWLYVSGGNDETDYWEHEPPPLEKAAAARIAELEASLGKINALIDSPSRFNADVQAVLDSVIDPSDTKSETQS